MSIPLSNIKLNIDDQDVETQEGKSILEAALDADIADTAMEDEEDDEDVIDLLDAVEPEALAAEKDELADLETRAETTLTETFDSTEELDIGITQEAPPTAEEDI